VEGKSFMGKAKDRAKRAAILMAVVGFIFSSGAVTLLYVFQSKDATTSSSAQQKALEQLKAQQEAAQAAQAANEPLEGYSAAAFDKAAVTSLQVETLKEGDGTAATATSTVKANYFGWTSDGKIFDSSKKQGAEAKPIDFSLSGVIKGWTDGLTGVKAGSVVKLTIPADQAYGAAGSPPSIGANEPLQFIVSVEGVN
jgi:peptidylprolyl isomerase